jgi:malonyl-CoA decarboxylase
MSTRTQDQTADTRTAPASDPRAEAGAQTRTTYGLLQTFVDRWRDFSLARAVGLAAAAPRTDLGPSDLVRLRQQMHDCLTARGGEASARTRAIELGSLYLGLSAAGRRAFLGVLASDFAVDRRSVEAAATALLATGDDPARWREAATALKATLAAPRQRLLVQFNALPQGTKFLVDLRADVLDQMRTAPELAPVEQDLKALLTGWFDIGFLELRRITWDSPASLLEKVARYEAVHAVKSWDDLKNRLDSDRRLFAFFHPRMPDEPLIFVEVALVAGLADSVAVLLDETAPAHDPQGADTAIFYSISNAQKGLAGISFGGFLIKRVVDELKSEFPRLRAFATLSPIPGFRRWLEERLAAGTPGLLTTSERKAIAALTGGRGGKGDLKALLADPAALTEPRIAAVLRGPLARLCAVYLVETRRSDGRASDPVAHFHLSNGARVERINWMGDPTANGMRQSWGLMVNYAYRLPEIEDNHEAYASGQTIRASSAVRGLLG